MSTPKHGALPVRSDEDKTMKNSTKLILTTLALATASIGSAKADSYADVKTTNFSSNSVWITYYNATKNQLGTHCLAKQSTINEDFTWADVVSSLGGVYLRFEYKQNTDCTGKTLADTHYGGEYQMPGLGSTLTVNIPAR